MGFLEKLKERLGTSVEPEIIQHSDDTGYVELDADVKDEEKARIAIKPFVLEEFDSVKPILDALREGRTISLVNIKPLKDRDLIELKRAINKLKKTCDAVEGDIAGFGENWIAVAPSFAKIHRGKQEEQKEQEHTSGY